MSLIFIFFIECQTEPPVKEKMLQSVIVKQKLKIANLQTELKKMKTELTTTKQQLEKSTAKLMSYDNITDEKTLNFLTGVQTKALFLWILSLVKDNLKQVITTFSYENHLLFVLMKLKLGHSNKDLALRFNIKEQYASVILRNWLPTLASSLKSLIVWPSQIFSGSPWSRGTGVVNDLRKGRSRSSPRRYVLLVFFLLFFF